MLIMWLITQIESKCYPCATIPPSNRQRSNISLCPSGLSTSSSIPLPFPELLLASPVLFTCAHGWSGWAGLRNSVQLRTCMGRRAIKFLGSALGRDCSCSTMVLHRYVFLLHTGFCTAASSPTCQQTTPVLALEKASTTTATEATTPPMPQLVQERSRGILPFPYC